MKNLFLRIVNKKLRLGPVVITAAALVVIAVLATYFVASGGFGGSYADDAEKYAEIEKVLNDNYIGDVDPKLLVDSAAAGMVRSLGDKWSYYMTAEEYEAYKLSSNNEYAGIGLSIELTDDGRFRIGSVFDGTPADSAGMTENSYLISVDGTELKGMSLTDVQNLIRSKLNTDFDVIAENSDGEEKTYTLTCTAIYRSPVSHKMLDDDIGYVKISNFEAGSADEAIKAIDYLMNNGAEAFIFDVRNNPGGLLSELVKLLDYLLPEGELFVSVDKNGNETVTSSDKMCLKSNIAVLVNSETYSAAEFFAAAIQEFSWGEIVGEQTTGKSRSQITIELSDGSAVHLSTSKYLTPNRVDLAEAGGVVPDKLSVDNEETEKIDEPLEAAKKLLVD